MNETMIRLAGLWESTTRDGRKMLSGTLGPNARLVILPVKHRQNDKSPTHTVFIAQRDDEQGQAKPQAGGTEDFPF